MTTAYPTGIDSFPSHSALQVITSANLNNMQDALVAIQNELGTVPSGAYTDVASRLSTGLRVDIRDPQYGTLGVSVAGDTSVLNAALTAAGAGGEVFIPASVTLSINAVTVSGRNIVGRGTITGTGLLSLITLEGDRAGLYGVTIRNDGGTQVVVLSSNSTRPTIRDCTIGGGTTESAIGVHVNTTGISRLRIVDCEFDLLGYGVLTNSSAPDVRQLDIVRNSFRRISGDPIELNHPGVAGTALWGCRIIGNDIEATLGSGTSAGFGVGIAGGRGVLVAGNTFGSCRTEAVHLEDECAFITVFGNTFSGSPIGVWALDGNDIVVSGNTFENQTSDAIQFGYDVTNSPDCYVINGNTIKGATGDGISITTGYVQHGRVTNNVISNCGGNGIGYYGSTTACPDGRMSIEGNVITGCTGYGIQALHHATAVIRNNFPVGNTAGSYGRVASSVGLLIPITNPVGEATATVTSTFTAWSTMFPIGDRARGILVVTAALVSNATNRTQRVFDVSWDGTTLTATSLGSSISNGIADGIEVRSSGGNLQVRTFCNVADGGQVLLWAQFEGVVLL